jgi:hypothetical protein
MRRPEPSADRVVGDGPPPVAVVQPRVEVDARLRDPRPPRPVRNLRSALRELGPAASPPTSHPRLQTDCGAGGLPCRTWLRRRTWHRPEGPIRRQSGRGGGGRLCGRFHARFVPLKSRARAKRVRGGRTGRTSVRKWAAPSGAHSGWTAITTAPSERRRSPPSVPPSSARTYHTPPSPLALAPAPAEPASRGRASASASTSARSAAGAVPMRSTSAIKPSPLSASS